MLGKNWPIILGLKHDIQSIKMNKPKDLRKTPEKADGTGNLSMPKGAEYTWLKQ